MNRLRRIAVTAGALTAVLALMGAYRFAASRGVLNSVQDTQPGQCRTLSGPVEDIAVAGGTAYVAGGGGLSAYHGGKLERLTGTPKQFSVAALGAVATVNGDTFLRSVLNQGGGRFAIAVFRQKPGGVEEIGRITSDEVQDPAAVVAADPERFYLVNRHEAKTALGRWLDDTLLLPRAHLLWFDGMKFVPVAEHLNTPSGLALSADGTRLFIAQDYPRTIAAMTRYEFSGAIENPAALNMPSGPLKLTVAGDGSLIVAARPKAGSGEVYRVVLENGQPKSASLLYAQKGEEVRAAAELPGTLLVGTSKALIACRIK